MTRVLHQTPQVSPARAALTALLLAGLLLSSARAASARDAQVATDAVWWEPTAPVAGSMLTIHYDLVARGVLPANTAQARIHVGDSGWQSVLDPDPFMGWSPSEAAWYYVYSIPSSATAVDFVFNDGLGRWDNNGGSDWHVPVTGAVLPPYAMDGALDPGVPLVASCEGRDLHAAYDGHWLYVAGPPATLAGGLDHFILVTRPSTVGTHGAPWTKTGVAPTWDLYIGAESTNGTAHWFDANTTVTTRGAWYAIGTVLEGVLDVTQWWNPAPLALEVCLAGYGTDDLGALQFQAPCGNADASLDSTERVTVWSSAVLDVPRQPAAGAALRLLSPNPTRGRVRAAVDAGVAGHVTVDLLDLSGRLVQRLHDGPATGAFEVEGTLPRHAAGVYFLGVRTPAGWTARRIVALP